MSQPPEGADPAVGLCSLCAFARVQRSARGSVFWRCLRAETDAGYRSYPPLPVERCPGFEALGETGR